MSDQTQQPQTAGGRLNSRSAGFLRRGRVLLLGACAMLKAVCPAAADDLEPHLKSEGVESLARAAAVEGDARRGAILFHQPHMACAKCHATGGGDESLGPDLARLPADVTDVDLVEAVLFPSKTIRKGYEPVTVVTAAGKTFTGLVAGDTDGKLVLRDASQDGRRVTLAHADIVEHVVGRTSIMPEGQVNQLAGRQQFLDLARYLIEMRRGGPERARELQPPASAIVLQVPEYEQRVDHAGLIADLDDEAFERGAAIYNRLCVNCHGTHDRPGTLPTAPRFASAQFKNGSDPHSLYRTLTYGFGMMVPQTWMVPRQKYDVIHYVREAYLKEHNPAAYVALADEYLASLPPGDTRGPEPRTLEPWITMDYGPSLIHTYEIGRSGENFAHKGIAVRLDSGPGGISRGRAWIVFDHDTLRVAAAWTGEGFIDWNGIQFNGRHAVHPRIVGDVQFASPTGPGWANPETGTFEDNQRVRGRDGRMYGPLPREWARYKGLYHHGERVIVAYTVGETNVLETPALLGAAQSPAFTRTFHIGPRRRDLVLQVARHPSPAAVLTSAARDGATHADVVRLGLSAEQPGAVSEPTPLAFAGGAWLEVADGGDFDMTRRDYSITARIRTREGGTIFARTEPGDEWVPDGKALFVRGGRLCFDIGWVGVVESRGRINDGAWHDVAVTWSRDTGAVRLYIDGRLDGDGQLKPRQAAEGHVVRIGFAAPDFPAPRTLFDGDISDVRFWKRRLRLDEVKALDANADVDDEALVAAWNLSEARADRVADLTGQGHDAAVRGESSARDPREPVAAGVWPAIPGSAWVTSNAGDLRLRIPAGAEPLRFLLWLARTDDTSTLDAVVEKVRGTGPAEDLTALTTGGPRRWPQELVTEAVIGGEAGPFAVDVLTPPTDNPWLAQIRTSGFDFFPGGDRAAVCTWDGDVWIVSGLNGLPATASPRDAAVSTSRLTWQRFATGLFQPLGLKIINDNILVTCRDQIAALHDLNGDGEADFVESFNSDHQVTEHFHEFATGLQTDAQGNLYYAKAARHALPAVVPHHGTLLRVSADGSRTEILATGFRAPNGVCVNDDGTFYLTDQEGHWTPKNRLNRVREGGFYGNMWGYHDVADASDAAMEPPLCWITNAFDRSPAEPLRVPPGSWGPLAGSLLNLSYGYGKVHVVLREQAGDMLQGGMCELPIPQFPTGIMRGRFHPGDGQLYACGLFAWASNQQAPGGFYRVRYTGQPLHVPLELHARRDGVSLRFTDPLDAESAQDPARYSLTTWSLKRSAEYGSAHHHQRALPVTSASLSDDGRTVLLTVPELRATQCMRIGYELRADDGTRVTGEIHNTIHALPE